MEGEIVNVVNLGKEVTLDVKFTNGETVNMHPIDLRPIGNDSTKPPHFTLQDIVESDFHICSKLETLSGKVTKIHECANGSCKYEVLFCDGETIGKMEAIDLRKCKTKNLHPEILPFLEGHRVEVRKSLFWIKGKMIFYLILFQDHPKPKPKPKPCNYFAFFTNLGNIISKNGNNKVNVMYDNAEIEFLRINNVDTCVRHFVPYKDYGICPCK